MSLEPWEIQEIAEGQDFEAKKAAGRDGLGQLPDSFWETYSAMANTEGGLVLLGLEEKDDGPFSVHGIVNVKKVLSELWNFLNNGQKVSSNVLTDQDVTAPEIGGKKVIQIRIPRASRGQMPVFLGSNPFGHTFRRNYEGDYHCDDETVKRMLADQVEDVRDGKLLENYSFEDTQRISPRPSLHSLRMDSWCRTGPRERPFITSTINDRRFCLSGFRAILSQILAPNKRGIAPNKWRPTPNIPMRICYCFRSRLLSDPTERLRELLSFQQSSPSAPGDTCPLKNSRFSSIVNCFHFKITTSEDWFKKAA